MTAGVRVAAFAALLAVVFAAAALAGRAPGEIAFRSLAPVPGSYRLFLQFRHGGRVHTAAFTRAVTS